jgi:16S rRNA (adenine1518-N6/adenine1519-N6)-dimethyltransferase
MLQYRFHIEWLIDVPPESFDPPPKVQSAVVRLIPKDVSELGAKSQEKLSRVVQAAFSQRRKMLRNTLKGVLSDEGFADLGIIPTCRAEDVSVADYVRIANYLS